MNIEQLLKGIPNCSCGQPHTCAVKHIFIENGAVSHLSQYCTGFSHIVLVADSNTFPTCGEQVVSQLAGKLDKQVIFAPKGLLIPNEESIAAIEEALTDETDLIIGIGSGVINDLCKYVSFQRKLPYYIIATAPSMDGYVSVGAAMITNHMKVTYSTHVPTAIFADVEILRQAPMRMIQSGFGDIIGKYSALNDWKLAHLVNGEYLCDRVYDIIYKMVLQTERLADGIQTRDPQAIKTLMEALVIVGIAMCYVGNSRPASGSEHHLSHYFEITGILNDREYFLHGIDVAYSTVQTQLLREEILKLEAFPDTLYCHDTAGWSENIRRCYGIAAEGVMALQEKCGFYQKNFPQIYKENWTAIRQLLSEVPSAQHIRHILEVAGLDFAEFEELYGKQAITDCIWFAKDLKDRYTVLWMYFLLFRKGY